MLTCFVDMFCWHVYVDMFCCHVYVDMLCWHVYVDMFLFTPATPEKRVSHVHHMYDPRKVHPYKTLGNFNSKQKPRKLLNFSKNTSLSSSRKRTPSMAKSAVSNCLGGAVWGKRSTLARDQSRGRGTESLVPRDTADSWIVLELSCLYHNFTLSFCTNMNCESEVRTQNPSCR